MIRKAEIKDTHKIYELLKQIASLHSELYPSYFPDQSPKYNHQAVEELINDSFKTVLVYEDDTVEGYLIGWNVNNRFFIDDLCVDNASQGKGIGKQLIESLTQYTDAQAIELNVWNKNITAIEFYNKLGFEPLKQVLVKNISK